MIESTLEDIDQDLLFPPLGLSDFESEENEFELLAGKALSALFNASGIGSGRIAHSEGDSERNYGGGDSRGSSETSSPTLQPDAEDTPSPPNGSAEGERQDPLFPPYSRSDSISPASLSSTAACYFSEGDIVEDSPLCSSAGFRGERYYLSSRRELGAGVRSNSDSSTTSSAVDVIDYASSPSTSPVDTPFPSSSPTPTLASRRAAATPRSPLPSTSTSSISLIPSTPESVPRKSSINLELLRLGSPSAGIDGRGIDGLMSRSTRRPSSLSPSRSTHSSTSLNYPTTTGGFELSVVRNSASTRMLKGVGDAEEEERGRLECPLTPGLDKICKRKKGGFVF